MIELENKKVLITGGSSMIGTSVASALIKNRAYVASPTHKDFNLLNLSETQQMFLKYKPDYVIHCAGYNGGIKYNKDFPADIFYKTTTMAMNVLMSCADFETKKVVSLISSCALPDRGEEVLQEKNLWDGLPNPSVECHGLSKRMLHAYSRQINKQFGTNAVCAILTNCYGPGDSFHPDKTKVVGAMIRRVVEAKINNAPEIVCWGTGRPLRELMYSVDAGQAIVEVLLKYDDVQEPINIGSDVEISIRELVESVAKIVGYEGKIIWDTTKTDGQMRKKLDTTKMHKLLNVDITPWDTALANTINWYINNKDFADGKK